MTVTRVGAASTTECVTSGTGTAAYSQAPTVGNLLTLVVTAAEWGGGPSAISAPAGWTAGPTGGGTGVTSNVNLLMRTYWKVATGGDAAPAMTVQGSWGVAATIEEWANSTGWPGSPLDASSTVGVNTQDSTAAGTCNSGPVTTTASGCFIWSAMGASTAALTARILTWGGGSASISTSAIMNTILLATAVQSPAAAGTYTPTLAFASNAEIWYAGATASMAFKTTTPPVSKNAVNNNTFTTALVLDGNMQ